MRKRLLRMAVLAAVLAPAGCTRYWCERQGYAPVAAAAYPAYQQPCCVPCCPAPCAPASTGYAAPAQGWNGPYNNGCCGPQR